MTKPQPQFDIFWEAYPKRSGCKRGKKQAKAQWLKLKPSPELIQTIMDWLEHDKKLRERNRKRKQFYAPPKDAFRWLRDERWEDELEPLPKPNPKPVAKVLVTCGNCGCQQYKGREGLWMCPKCGKPL